MSDHNILSNAHVQLKPGAKIATIAPAGIRILAAIDSCAESAGVVVTITSGSEDRGRLATDPHMTGEAFDISVNGFTDHQIIAIVGYLRLYLGVRFTVLYEVPKLAMTATPEMRGIATFNPSATAPHIHIQRMKGTTWPPTNQTSRA